MSEVWKQGVKSRVGSMTMSKEEKLEQVKIFVQVRHVRLLMEVVVELLEDHHKLERRVQELEKKGGE